MGLKSFFFINQIGFGWSMGVFGKNVILQALHFQLSILLVQMAFCQSKSASVRQGGKVSNGSLALVEYSVS